MALADVRHDADSRLGNGRQLGNLSQAAHAHFDDAGFVPFRQLQQRARQADFVVEIFFRLQHVIFLRQDGGNHISRRRLADGARYGYDGNGKTAAMEAGQSLIGLQRIVCDENSNAVLSVFVPHFGHDNAGRALLHGFADKIMTVKPLALEGYKQRVPADDPRIRFHAGK